MVCLDRETATAYVGGLLDPQSAQYYVAHLANCEQCRCLVEEISGLVDEVRRILVLADDPRLGNALPPSERVRRRYRPTSRVPKIHLPPFSFRQKLDRLQIRVPQLHMPGWAFKTVIGVVAILLFIFGVQFFSDRQVAHANEILRRADQAAGNVRNIPGRIIHRAWKETIVNGYGPLADGEYRFEYWWDNVNHQSAYVRYDATGHLREGNWVLADGRSYTFIARDGSTPVLAAGPPDSEVFREIQKLPFSVREQVRTHYQRVRRPFYESAAEIASCTEKEISASKADPHAEISVQEVTTPSGRKLYRVRQRVGVPSPETKIKYWDVERLVADTTYYTIEIHSRGYRTDGLIYTRDRVLTDEQVLMPGGKALGIFKPGPFPPATQIHQVTSRERTEAIVRQLKPLPS